MNDAFWAGLLRDAVLVLIGAGLTGLGGWLKGRRENRHRREDRDRLLTDAAADRARATMTKLRDGLLSMYKDVREEQLTSHAKRASIDRGALVDMQNTAELIPDEALRQPIVMALRAMNGLTVAIDNGFLEYDIQIRIQGRILSSALGVLNAAARGDVPPAELLAYLQTVGDATAKAWSEQIEEVTTNAPAGSTVHGQSFSSAGTYSVRAPHEGPPGES